MDARAATLALALLAMGCPPQKQPDRGIELTYRKPDKEPLRPVVEKRLAALKVKARIDEDGDTLRLRIPEGIDPGPVKRVMARRAKFELCEEVPADARRLCETEPPEAIRRVMEDAPGEGCYFVGADRDAVRKLAQLGLGGGVQRGDGGAETETTASSRTVLQKVDDGWRTYVVPHTCLSPGIAEASAREVSGMAWPVVHLRFDRHGGEQFEALTTRLVQKRLLIVLDDEVQIAPVVMEPIRGGAAQLTTGPNADDVQSLAAALEGGVLPALTLEVEKAYGPPSLLR